MAVSGKKAIKYILGQIPFTAEIYWQTRQKGSPINSRFSLKGLQGAIPELIRDVEDMRQTAPKGKNIFVFATLHYWIEHAAVMGLSLAAQGHNVTLGFLPYSDWQSPTNKFDLRRQNAYALSILSQLKPVMESVSLLMTAPPLGKLPENLEKEIDIVSHYDTQYTLQVEDVDTQDKIYRLRDLRNKRAGHAAYKLLGELKPDTVIVPNGTIQELGVVYRVAKYLKIPTVTYEFGDQRRRVWIAQNTEVMRQETDEMWKAAQDIKLNEAQLDKIRSLCVSRKKAALWENFARVWQDTPAQGGGVIRQQMGLDERPVVLLATNVLGDSLTLGRHIFSRNMAEWISRTVQYFAGVTDYQLIIRIHPGEVLTHGQSMADVVHQLLPKLPEHIHLVDADNRTNTYDLIDIADLGLVYTTTVGLEMAMAGLPVIVSGQTHYRNRGFTFDPDSWVVYLKTLKRLLDDPKSNRLDKSQVEKAWSYAYHFFFVFPRPYPWHLVRMWDDFKENPLKKTMTGPDWITYQPTFKYLVGEPIHWKKVME